MCSIRSAPRWQSTCRQSKVLRFAGADAGLAEDQHHRRRPAVVAGEKATPLLRSQVGDPFDRAAPHGLWSRHDQTVFRRTIGQPCRRLSSEFASQPPAPEHAGDGGYDVSVCGKTNNNFRKEPNRQSAIARLSKTTCADLTHTAVFAMIAWRKSVCLGRRQPAPAKWRLCGCQILVLNLGNTSYAKVTTCPAWRAAQSCTTC